MFIILNCCQMNRKFTMRNRAVKSIHSILIVENKDSLFLVENCDKKSLIIELKLVFQIEIFNCLS